MNGFNEVPTNFLPSEGVYVFFTGIPHQYVVRSLQGNQVKLEVVIGEDIASWLYTKWKETHSSAS